MSRRELADKDLKTYFDNRVLMIPFSTCHYWDGHIEPNRYGRARYKGIRYRAHRLAYSLYVGDIPEGLYVCHTCDTPSCVNPDHLFLGDALDNARDMVSKGRSLLGERHHASKLTEADVLEIRDRVKMGHKQNVIAMEYGVTAATLNEIIHRKTWRHI